MDVWVIDFESFWSTEYTLSKLTTDGYVLDPRWEVQGLAVVPPKGPAFHVDPPDVGRFVASVDWSNAAAVAHNMFFDGFAMLYRCGGRPAKLWCCTLQMARFCLPAGVRGSLAAVADYLGLPPKGNETVNTRGRRYHTLTAIERKRLADYAMHDAWLCKQVLLIFLGLAPAPSGRPVRVMPAGELTLVHHTLRMFLEPTLQLNEARLLRFQAELEERRARLLASCGMSDRDALMSDALFAEQLELRGVEPPTKTSPTTGNITWAFSKRDPAFKELLEHDDPTVCALVEARLDAKSTGDATRTERLLSVARSQRPWPILLNYGGAKQTLRWSGGNRQNPQNLRRGGALREAIEPPPGHVVVVVDSSQIEARTLAAEARQLDLVEQFRRGDDTYASLATRIYGRPINKKTDPLERQVGKTGRLGLGYGMGHAKFHLALKTDPIMPIDMPIEDCANVVKVYRTIDCPRIPELWRAMDYAIQLMNQGVSQDFGWYKTIRNGMVLPSGYTIDYDGLHWGTYKFQGQAKSGWWYYKNRKLTALYGAKAVENLTQAIARSIVADQLTRVASEVFASKYRHRWAHMAHDEGVFVVPSAHADDVLKLALAEMHVCPSWAPVPVPVAAEGGIGATYAEAK